MGASLSGDLFVMKIKEVLWSEVDLRCFVKDVDDVLLIGDTMAELEEQFHLSLRVCRRHSLMLSRKKVQLTLTDVESIVFAGFSISAVGCSQDPAKIQAVMEFPVPKYRAQVRSWLGLSMGFQLWFKGITKGKMAMRRYLQKDAVFDWDE